MLDGILKEHKIKTQSLAPFKQVQILLKDTKAETESLMSTPKFEASRIKDVHSSNFMHLERQEVGILNHT